MRKKVPLIIGFLILTSFVGISIGNLLPTEKQSVEKIFTNERIEIQITNHGGFGANVMGISKMTVKRKNNGNEYQIKYNDKLDGKKIDLIISKEGYDELRTVFYELIEFHDNTKKLNGDCVLIDKNYELKSGGLKMFIKPNKNSANLYALDSWIYKHYRE